jgi:phosphoribosylglycinamide formyltransferase-1
VTTRVVVLISGSGRNLQALIECQQAGGLAGAEIVAVISNKAQAFGLERAKSAGISTAVLSHKEFDSREAFDNALSALIDDYQPDLVVLAGFMRILTPEFTLHYANRMLNIHPSLLPKYQGLNTHQRALDADDQEHGASVHFVSAELDGGPVVIQGKVPVMAGDNAETLADRVMEIEQRIYPQAVQWFANGELEVSNNNALRHGQPLPQVIKHEILDSTLT